MEDSLNMDNLFLDLGSVSDTEEEKVNENALDENENIDENDDDNEAIDSDENQKESVDGEDEDNEGEDTNEEKRSSNNNFYSAIANAFREDGVFPDLSDDDIKNTASAEAFRKLVEDQISKALDEKQKRIDSALSNDVSSDTVRSYETLIERLDNISNDTLESEDSTSENLRKQLIMQDYLNRGYSNERAEKKLKQSISNGDDIDDAKDALASLKDYYKSKYNGIIEEAKAEKERQRQEQKNSMEKFKADIIGKDSFKDFGLSDATKKRIYDCIAKPVYKENNVAYSKLQKYQKENPNEFIKYAGMFFELTDGFKDFSKLINSQVSKKMNKHINDLERTLQNTRRTSSGNLDFIGGGDSEGYIGFKLDV